MLNKKSGLAMLGLVSLVLIVVIWAGGSGAPIKAEFQSVREPSGGLSNGEPSAMGTTPAKSPSAVAQSKPPQESPSAVAQSKPPQEGTVLHRRPAPRGLAERFPSGLLAAMDQAVVRQDGRSAYELAEVLGNCVQMPEEIERNRASLADLQTKGVLMQADRHLADTILATLQRDWAVCQSLSGDLKALRLQLLVVAAKAGVDGSGMDLLLAGNKEPWVKAQVLREAESGELLALRNLADGQIPQATRLQIDAARDAIVRGSRDAELNADPHKRLAGYLASVERQLALETWAADPTNPAKTAIAKAAYQGNGAPRLEPSTDPQVTALSTQYLEALKKRRRAEAPQP